MNGDPYKILGVSHDASDEDIKKAYRALVKQYHPDLHPGDEAAAAKMSEINSAYECIKSRAAARTANRTEYDPESDTVYVYMDSDDIFEAVFNSFAKDGFVGRADYELYDMLEKCMEQCSYRQAARILDAIRERDGRWYYFAARVYLAADKVEDAYRHAECAVNMEPGNETYKQLLEEISGRRVTDLTGFLAASAKSIAKKVMSEKYVGVRFAVTAYIIIVLVCALIFAVFMMELNSILGI